MYMKRQPAAKASLWHSIVFIILGILLLLSLSACAEQTPVSENVLPGTAETPGVKGKDVEIERLAEIVVGVLVVSAFVSLVTQRLKVPYTIGLVLAGLAVSIFWQALITPLSPEVILVILLPPLLFEAVVRANIRELRRALVPVLILSVPGVILTTLLVGGVLALGSSLPLTYAFVFGALIAPTDPVSILALFRTIGVPKRLMAVFEGESLFNDGTAIVLFKLMLVIALTGRVNVGQAVGQFLLVAGGGIVVGIAIGVLFAFILNRIDHYVVETTLTVVLAYGTFLVGELFFGVSGVLAVVAAGLTVSALSKPKLSPTSRIFVTNFWEYVAFLANSFIFLMIGLQTKVGLLLENIPWIIWSILAVIIARALVVWSLHFFHRGRIPFQWSAVLFWGGLRGAVSLALALSLSFNVQYREQIQAMTFGVVLFSLIVQGSTLPRLVKRLGLIDYNQNRLVYERQHAQNVTLHMAARRLEALGEQGLVPRDSVETLLPMIHARIEQAALEEKELFETNPVMRQEALDGAWFETLRAQRGALVDLYQDNIISEEVYLRLASEIDEMITDESRRWPEIQAVLDQRNAAKND
jgi:CPA1 family monovalent cation:H+ antiporter